MRVHMDDSVGFFPKPSVVVPIIPEAEAGRVLVHRYTDAAWLTKKTLSLRRGNGYINSCEHTCECVSSPVLALQH